ncbi:MAG: superoxide dismutase family protein [Intrasporangium sp.]|uniref:superoxide dismutase family protein n=1 Tax=Intrasporangium sp. TaxID=1925024 RepID=UPI003F7F8091
MNHNVTRLGSTASTSRRLRRAAIAGLGATAAGLASIGTAAAHAAPAAHHFSGALRDLQPAAISPFDGAAARALLVERPSGATVVLQVDGIDRAAAGKTYGAHLHVGPCIAGDGAAAGPHYNSDAQAGYPTPEVSQRTEVWLDFTVNRAGHGSATAVVPFTPAAGTRSIVVHAMETDHGTGGAGARIACLPVVW